MKKHSNTQTLDYDIPLDFHQEDLQPEIENTNSEGYLPKSSRSTKRSAKRSKKTSYDAKFNSLDYYN